MEVETPVDKSDLVRLKDEYGRESLGYESGESISTKVEEYDYCHFGEDITENEEVEKLLKKKKLKIKHSKNLKELTSWIHHDHKIICPLNFKLVDAKGKVFLEIGDIIDVRELQKKGEFFSVPEKGLFSLVIN